MPVDPSSITPGTLTTISLTGACIIAVIALWRVNASAQLLLAKRQSDLEAANTSDQKALVDHQADLERWVREKLSDRLDKNTESLYRSADAIIQSARTQEEMVRKLEELVSAVKADLCRFNKIAPIPEK